MINDRFTVTTANLNTHSDVFVDTLKTISVPSYNGGTENIEHYPIKIQFENKTGVDILVNILSSPEEYAAYVASPTSYKYFTVVNGAVTSLSAISILPPAYKIVCNLPTGSATADFIIECIQYIPRR